MGLLDDFGQLNSSEVWVLASRPTIASTIKEDSIKAREEAKRRFPDENSRKNGRGDAFRHCYWAALLTRDIGSNNARDFTNAHENTRRNPSEEKRMDLHNNAVGILIGLRLNHPSDATLIAKCEAALLAGQLKTLHD